MIQKNYAYPGVYTADFEFLTVIVCICIQLYVTRHKLSLIIATHMRGMQILDQKRRVGSWYIVGKDEPL